MNNNITDNPVLRDFCFKMAVISNVRIFDRAFDEYMRDEYAAGLIDINSALLSQYGFENFEQFARVVTYNAPVSDEQDKLMEDYAVVIGEDDDNQDPWVIINDAFWQAVAVINYATLDKDVMYELVKTQLIRYYNKTGEKQDV